MIYKNYSRVVSILTDFWSTEGDHSRVAYIQGVAFIQENTVTHLMQC